MPRRRTLLSRNTKIRRYQRDGRASKRPCACRLINRAVDLTSPVKDEIQRAFRTIGCVFVARLEPGMPNTRRCTAASGLLRSSLRAFTADETICLPCQTRHSSGGAARRVLVHIVSPRALYGRSGLRSFRCQTVGSRPPSVGSAAAYLRQSPPEAPCFRRPKPPRRARTTPARLSQ
jgi:hypothetical protein